MTTGLSIVVALVLLFVGYYLGFAFGAFYVNRLWQEWLAQHIKVKVTEATKVKVEDLYPKKDNESN